jgi:hypothetical protein
VKLDDGLLIRLKKVAEKKQLPVEDMVRQMLEASLVLVEGSSELVCEFDKGGKCSALVCFTPSTKCAARNKNGSINYV